MFKKLVAMTALTSTALALGLCGSAVAADLPNRVSPPSYAPPPPIFTWTGVYVGAQIGYQWGRSSTSVANVVISGASDYSANGVAGGAHFGYNYQSGFWVFGVEADFDATGVKGSKHLGTFAFTTQETYEGSARGRVGVAWNRALLYLTGGAAFGGFTHTYSSALPFGDNLSTLRTGWTIGAGLQYAVFDNWSLRAEYRYTDFGSYNDNLLLSDPGFYGRKHETNNSFRTGITYRFDTFSNTPVVAKY